MALINCPNCNKQISDKATICVGCGTVFDNNAAGEIELKILCPECGTEVSSFEESCPNCGCPLKIQNKTDGGGKERKSLLKSKGFWALILSAVLVTLGLAFWLNGKMVQAYNLELCSAVDKIMQVSAETESVGNLIGSVWNNAILDKDNQDTAKYTSNAKDFNEALRNLFADEEFINKIQNIREEQQQIDTYIVNLKNPPGKYKKAHNQFIELYYAYSDFTDFVINCQGSYNSYTEGFQKKRADLMEKHRKIKVLIYTN